MSISYYATLKAIKAGLSKAHKKAYIDRFGTEEGYQPYNGTAGDIAECYLDYYFNGIERYERNPAGLEDMYITIDGRLYSVAVKTGCGKTIDTMKADYVMYIPDVDLDFPIEYQTAVFTQAEWREFLNGYTGRGHFVRPDNGNIQSFYSETRPKASKPIRQYIDAVMFEATTADRFKAQIAEG